MKRFEVVYAPEAEAALVALFQHLASNVDPDTARRYLEGLLDHCESLDQLPLRGTPRDDIRAGLRVTPYRARTVIAYVVEGERVAIIGFFHGGQDYESRLHEALLGTDR